MGWILYFYIPFVLFFWILSYFSSYSTPSLPLPSLIVFFSSLSLLFFFRFCLIISISFIINVWFILVISSLLRIYRFSSCFISLFFEFYRHHLSVRFRVQCSTHPPPSNLYLIFLSIHPSFSFGSTQIISRFFSKAYFLSISCPFVFSFLFLIIVRH